MSTLVVEDHLGLVNHIARKMQRSGYVPLDFEEMVSAGMVGLMQASQSYDPTLGFAFSTFAAARIRGAILDELRRVDTMPRRARVKWQKVRVAEEALTQRLHRAPTDGEIADALGIDRPTLLRWRRDLESATTEPLEKSPVRACSITGSTGEEVESSVEREDEIARVRALFRFLRPRERRVLSLYYAEELNLREIGERIHLSESRVCQIHQSALRKLRARLRVHSFQF